MDSHSRPQSVDPTRSGQTPLLSPSAHNHFYHYNQYQQQQWPQQQQQHVYPPMDPMASHSGQQFAAGQQWPQQQPSADYMSQYYAQYYREYYRQYIQRQQHSSNRQTSLAGSERQPITALQRQPLKYGSRRSHARAVFSQHNNTLMVVDNTSGQHSRPLLLYSLQDLFVDYLFPQQFFHLLLRSPPQDTLPGLPFSSQNTCLDWIRSKQQTTDQNFELKLILKVIQMLLKQRGQVSGLDLSELLFDLLDFNALNQQFVYSSEDFQNNAVNQFRALLIRGQKSVALTHALNTGLFAHALTLSYLCDAIDDRQRRRQRRQTETTDETTMLKTVKKFCSTLRLDDPIAVLYNSLISEISDKKSLFSLSFESFLILLSNERDLKSIQVNNQSENAQSFRNLLDLIKSLMTTATTTGGDDSDDNYLVLNDELFADEMDFILVNECLEFSRFSGKKFNPKLLDQKLKFVSILFDFGFVNNALEYSRQLRQMPHISSSSVARHLLSQLESRGFYQNNFEEFADDDRPTTTEIDSVYRDDSQPTTVTTTPERHIQNVDDRRQPDDIPATEELSEKQNGDDFYGQMLSSPVVTSSPLQPQPPLQTPPMFSPMDIQPVFNLDNNVMPTGEEPPPLSFVSSGTTSLPSFPTQNDFFAENGIPNQFNQFNDRLTTDKTTDDDKRRESVVDRQETRREEEKTKSETNKSQNSSGLLNKLIPSVFKRGNNQAILPDDSKPTLIFDKNLNQWIDTSEQNGQSGGQPGQSAGGGMRAPPMGPPLQTGQQVGIQRFDKRNQRRYVDITRK